MELTRPEREQHGAFQHEPWGVLRPGQPVESRSTAYRVNSRWNSSPDWRLRFNSRCRTEAAVFFGFLPNWAVKPLPSGMGI